MGKEAAKESAPNEVQSVGIFGNALFDIGWRMLIVVVAGLWLGTKFDDRFHTEPWGALTGFLLIIVAFIRVIRTTLQQVPREYGGLKK